MGTTVERRRALRQTLYARYAGAFGGSRAIAWSAACIATGLVAAADRMTADVWLGPAYLLVICGTAWALGWREALGCAVACLSLTYLANDFALPSFGSGSQAADMAVRFSVLLITIGLVTTARRLYLREWRLARTDPLTGAMNRQAFFEIVSHAKPSEAWTVIAYADLDGFKQINDLCGHDEGDEALRGFANATRRSIRKTDLFARLGGDEFVVFMEVGDHSAAKMIAARLHLAMNLGLVRPSVSARCSLGVLILPPGAGRGSDRLRVADRLMYEAKQQGAALVAATLIDPASSSAIYRHLELTAIPAQTIVTSMAKVSQAAA